MLALLKKPSKLFSELLFSTHFFFLSFFWIRRCWPCQGSPPTGGGRPGPPSQLPLIPLPNHMWIMYFFFVLFCISSIFYIIFHGIISLYFCHILIIWSQYAQSTPAHPPAQPYVDNLFICFSFVFYFVFLLFSISYFMVLYPCISVIYQPYTQSTPAHPSAHPHVDNLFVLYFFCAVFRISSIFLSFCIFSLFYLVFLLVWISYFMVSYLCVSVTL